MILDLNTITSRAVIGFFTNDFQPQHHHIERSHWFFHQGFVTSAPSRLGLPLVFLPMILNLNTITSKAVIGFFTNDSRPQHHAAIGFFTNDLRPQHNHV
jgi:hypothetical protein